MNATGLAAGWLCGMIPPVNSPPVSSDPVPVAGHFALTMPPRQYGLKICTGRPASVVVEKSPARCFGEGHVWLSPCGTESR